MVTTGCIALPGPHNNIALTMCGLDESIEAIEWTGTLKMKHIYREAHSE